VRIRAAIFATLAAAAALAIWALQSDPQGPEDEALDSGEAAARTVRPGGGEQLAPKRAVQELPLDKGPVDHHTVTMDLLEAAEDATACPIDVDYEGRTLILDAEGRNPRMAIVTGGDLVLTGEPRDLIVAIPGQEPLRVAWTEEGCGDEVLRPVASTTGVVGRVTVEGDDPLVAIVYGCGGYAVSDDEGHYYLDALPGPCSIQASIEDGMLRASERIELVAVEGADVIADIEFSAIRTGGLGASVQAVDEGIRVLKMHGTGGGAAAGLVDGDLILAVDGEPTVDYDLERFIEKATGPVGTDVVLTVARGEGTEDLVVTRAVVE